jgi:septal ring factor EnvC (AmiA/AmiB activator)
LGLAIAGVAYAHRPAPTAFPPVAGSDIDSKLDWLQRRIHETDRELTELRKTNDMVRQRSILRARAYYRLVHAGLLPLGGGFDGLMRHTMQVERLRRSLDRDVAEMNRIARRREHLTALRTKLLERQAPLLVQKQAMAEARQALLDAQDRRAAFERAFSSSGGDYTAIYGTPGPGPWASSTMDSSSEGMGAWFGRLPFPLAGRVEVRDVRMPDADGPGLALRGHPGAVVRAVADGRVAFADTFGSYGRVIIIDHGDRYFTLSGQLQNVDVYVGERVHRGTPIGKVAVTGKHRGELYFEIRHAGRTVDPRPWFGL